MGRRVAARKDYAALAGAGGAQRTAERAAAVAAAAAKAAAKEEIGAARLAVQKATAEVTVWVAAAPPPIEADFADYGRAAVQPGATSSPSSSSRPTGRCGISTWPTALRLSSTR